MTMVSVLTVYIYAPDYAIVYNCPITLAYTSSILNSGINALGCAPLALFLIGR